MFTSKNGDLAYYEVACLQLLEDQIAAIHRTGVVGVCDSFTQGHAPRYVDEDVIVPRCRRYLPRTGVGYPNVEIRYVFETPCNNTVEIR